MTTDVCQIEDTKLVEVDGQKMLVDLRDKFVSSRLGAGRMYEGAERLLMRKHIKPGMTVIDVGAHIGWHTVLMSHLVGVSGTVWAYEPSARNYALLRHNIEDNCLDNVCAVSAAVWDSPTVVNLYLSPNNSGDHNLICDDSRESGGVGTVMLNSVKRADFIKCDAQGAEMAVLRGAKELIANSPNLVMLIEYSPKHLKALGEADTLIEDLQCDFNVVALGYHTVENLRRVINVENGLNCTLVCTKERART